jgi:hypothetical protein
MRNRLSGPSYSSSKVRLCCRPCSLSRQRAAGLAHKRRAQPNAYLGRKPSYDRATFDRIRLALGSAGPPSLSAIAKASAKV